MPSLRMERRVRLQLACVCDFGHVSYRLVLACNSGSVSANLSEALGIELLKPENS